MTPSLVILQGDALEQLRTLPTESVHCCVTSPPYWALRDYGTAQWEGGDAGCEHLVRDNPRLESSTLDGGKDSVGHQREGFRSGCPRCGAKRIDSQLGLERTPEQYVAKMVEVFREVRRVLRKDGTLWLNMGDSYASEEIGRHDKLTPNSLVGNDAKYHGIKRQSYRLETGLKPKDLCGMPWRLAFASQSDGWWLRSDIIWAKPNPMPESVTDRPSKAHEYIFLLTKASSYFYDAEAIREPHAESWRGKGESEHYTPCNSQGWNGQGFAIDKREYNPAGRNKRSVWTVATQPYPEAHFATFPEELPKLCILAGTSAKGCCARCGSPWERIVEKSGGTIGHSWHDHKDDLVLGQRCTAPFGKGGVGGSGEQPYKVETIGWQITCKCEADAIPCTVLDPFAGTFTTCAVALELGRAAIGIELNPKYVELGKQRCTLTPGLALA